MNTKRALALVGVAAAFGGTAAADAITSTFDSGTEGWMVGDADAPDQQSTTATPAHYDTQGNPGGMVTPPLIWDTEAFFIAPSKFLGDQSGKAGGYVSLDRRYHERGSVTVPLQLDYAVDLTLTGASMTLAVDLQPVPILEWGTQSVALSTDGGWFHLDTGVAATADELDAVLADLEDIRARVNLNQDGGNMGMDNFTLAPTPGSLTLVAIAGVASFRRRRG